MAEIAYINRRFSDESRHLIYQSRKICEEYAAQGFDLTLRQLYYQHVSRGTIENKQTEYKRLGSIINDARLAGLLDWNYIVDRTRNLAGIGGYWDSPADIIDGAAKGYSIDKWDDQPKHVEVWIEKDALVGVLERACLPYDVGYFSCRGYTSQSEIWGAAQRLGNKIEEGKEVRIIHLGDHDPSGIDMTRDITDRLSVFIAQDLGRCGPEDDAETCAGEIWPSFEVERIALNMDQVQRYNPPPNPAKLTDSRGSGYVARHGYSSWELDALDPATLVALIQNKVEDHRDEGLWEAKIERQTEERKILTTTTEHWTEVADFVREQWPDA